MPLPKDSSIKPSTKAGHSGQLCWTKKLQALSAEVLKALNFEAGDVDKLQTIPMPN
jgi:hypothetical protein